uniref:Fibronectin type III domain-containing protein n=1 Tax=Candidatus Kentrum sp. LPFa TaxID=2126335 RepID=A0A450WFK5_9GAMM|nr:MAG: Fibronectin type III domain-containing protein [Candidatus Kentron sp. LPFa]
MANFPRKESEVLILSREMVAGFNAHTDLYSAPLVSTADLAASIDTYLDNKNAELAARAAWEKTVKDKNEALKILMSNMKKDLRYAEIVSDFDDAQLRLLGWGGRKARKNLEAPGEARSLRIVAQGEGWITLEWKSPSDGGGAIAAYRIERKDPQADEREWDEVGTATGTDTMISKQERGKKWEFRVLAFNKAGAGEPSNTVSTVL